MVELKTKILVVDDMESIRETIRFYFNAKGYEVLTAESAEEALPIISEKSPEVILLDIHLPGMSGLELLKLVREFNKTVKVIMLTGSELNLKDKPQFKSLDIKEFLHKPITISKLKETLEKVLVGDK
jgi:two-component system response regulator (stage 0 sporulation protein F)